MSDLATLSIDATLLQYPEHFVNHVSLFLTDCK